MKFLMFAFGYFHLFSLSSVPSLLNLKAYIMKFMQEVEGLKVSNSNQSLKIESLEHELVWFLYCGC